ncbi:hypothetical protein AB0N06_22060 [Streptomyces sp. NPDC051020]|uniref:hypothetical protein n=1 Tax=Streptomyces sp. NPDC051020 TaxID=3155409 RepID=UPI00344528FE
MDLERIAHDLYGLWPQDFIDARTEYAAAARKAKDRALATQITALRRPILAAWASNLLVRTQPDQVARFLRLGEGLRQAHELLDPDQLRELSSQQHRLVGELARQARQLTVEAGHPVSEEVQHELEATLHAVLADAEAAQEWASGRLVKGLTPPVGFTATVVSGATLRPTPAPPPAPEAATRAEDRPRAGAQERRREEERRRKLAQARQDAKAAEQQAQQQEEELRRAEAQLEQAETLLQEAEQGASAVTRQLAAAQEAHAAARGELEAARRQAAEAGRAARKARRDAQAAHTRAERLQSDL